MPDFSINQLGTTKRLCPDARAFGQFVEQTIFSKITRETDPEQYQHVQNLLLALCEQFASKVTCGTFPTAVGIHSCVRDIYEDAAARLACLAVMYQPAPLPPPAPVPKQQLITQEGIVRDVEGKISTSTDETYLGNNAKLPQIRRDG